MPPAHLGEAREGQEVTGSHPGDMDVGSSPSGELVVPQGAGQRIMESSLQLIVPERGPSQQPVGTSTWMSQTKQLPGQGHSPPPAGWLP